MFGDRNAGRDWEYPDLFSNVYVDQHSREYIDCDGYSDGNAHHHTNRHRELHA